ncbi:hypothetical protein [Candidatus Hodarchaeum mangrovi]|nr:hypothetical protein [Asgard group archaeon]
MNKEIQLGGYEICKVCGFIRPAGKGGICSACGARERAFIPFEHKASKNRREYLKFDVHPVIVHFTVSYTATMVILFLINEFITDNILGMEISPALDLIILLLPLLVMLAGITGLIDGKVRYRKLLTPYLRLKISMGVALFIDSLFILLFHIFIASQNGLFFILKVILILAAIGLASGLGWFGTKLVGFIVPRGIELK